MTSQDFKPRLDITALTAVTGSEMDQLVSAALPADDKGLIIETQDTALDVPFVPNPNVVLENITPTHWVRYLWKRVPFNPTGVIKTYQWNPLANSDATFLKWVWMEKTANDALTSVTSAVDTANTANGNATLALTKATTALANSTTAIANAATAQATATEALSKANGSITDISNLQSEVFDLQNPGTLPIAKGGTGATDAAGARANLGITNLALAVFYVLESKVQGANGGGSVAGTQVRALNQMIKSAPVAYDTYCVLNGDNTVTLQAGVWMVEAEAPAFYVGSHRISLFDVDDNVTVITGSSEFTNNPAQVVTKSRMFGILKFVAARKVYINHYTSAIQAVNGLGVASNVPGFNEIYTQAKFTYLGSL